MITYVRDILLKVVLNYDLKVVHGTRESEFYSYFSVFQIPDQLGPTDIEERPDADIEKVIKVEEVTNQETSSDTPIMEKITGIFKRDQSSSSSSSDSESEKDDVKPVPHKEEMVHRKSWVLRPQFWDLLNDLMHLLRQNLHLSFLYSFPMDQNLQLNFLYSFPTDQNLHLNFHYSFPTD